jgi:hypothetical protein
VRLATGVVILNEAQLAGCPSFAPFSQRARPALSQNDALREGIFGVANRTHFPAGISAHPGNSFQLKQFHNYIFEI